MARWVLDRARSRRHSYTGHRCLAPRTSSLRGVAIRAILGRSSRHPLRLPWAWRDEGVVSVDCCCRPDGLLLGRSDRERHHERAR